MSDYENNTIRKIHNLTNPSTLYEGESLTYAGETTHQKIRIAYTTRWRALMNIPSYLAELKSRRDRAKQFTDRRVFTPSQLAD